MAKLCKASEAGGLLRQAHFLFDHTSTKFLVEVFGVSVVNEEQDTNSIRLILLHEKPLFDLETFLRNPGIRIVFLTF